MKEKINIVCFECGNYPCEAHHVVPQVLGGTKTIPLCSLCHSKVHWVNETKRATSISELTKIGIDKKNRSWDLFSIHILLMTEEKHINNIEKLHSIYIEYFKSKISLFRFNNLVNRYLSLSEEYLLNLFDETIDNTLQHTWNPKKLEERFQLNINYILDLSKKAQDENLTEDEIRINIKNYLNNLYPS